MHEVKERVLKPLFVLCVAKEVRNMGKNKTAGQTQVNTAH